jgi:hypothetical protein
MHRGAPLEREAPVKVYKAAVGVASIMIVVGVFFAGVTVFAAGVEHDPWWLLVTVFWLVLAFVCGISMRGRVDVWPDRMVVRQSGRSREFRFDECSEFKAVTMPGLSSGGLVVGFAHAPGGQVTSPRFTRFFGRNTWLPKCRGGAPGLARDLNQFRERWLAGDGVQG